MLVIWTILGVLVLRFVIKYIQRKKYNLPPGPAGLPFIGNIYQFDAEQPHDTITKWSDRYGDVFKLLLFGKTTVILNSFETIYEGLVTQANTFAGRPESYRIEAGLNFCPDVVNGTFTPEWILRKKLTLQTLKMYGDNLLYLETLSIELINEMIEELKLEAEKESSIIFPIYHRCVTRIITSVLFGEKVDDETQQKIMEANAEFTQLTTSTGPSVILDAVPFIRYLPNPWSAKLWGVGKAVKSIIDPRIKDRKANSEPGQPVCFTDGLLDYQKKTNESGTGMKLSDDVIFGLNFDLIGAGTFTTSATLNCLIAIVINKPEIQSKMYNEIMQEIGDRTPRLSDRKQMNYVEAVILEVFRYSSIIPLNVPHCTMEDAKINGYDIPKGTQVLYNFWKLHHDAKLWDEPWEFKPERYLDEDGIIVSASHVNRKRLMAFGASRRVCVGETLAKNRLFLMVTALLQQFQLLPGSKSEIPGHDPRTYKNGFGIMPHHYSVKLVVR